MRLRLKMKILQQYGSQSDFAMACGKRDDWLSRIITGRRDPSDDEKQTIMSKLGAEDENSLFANMKQRVQTNDEANGRRKQ